MVTAPLAGAPTCSTYHKPLRHNTPQHPITSCQPHLFMAAMACWSSSFSACTVPSRRQASELLGLRWHSASRASTASAGGGWEGHPSRLAGGVRKEGVLQFTLYESWRHRPPRCHQATPHCPRRRPTACRDPYPLPPPHTLTVPDSTPRRNRSLPLARLSVSSRKGLFSAKTYAPAARGPAASFRGRHEHVCEASRIANLRSWQALKVASGQHNACHKDATQT